MNYIKLINAFWKINAEANFKPMEIALYFYLLDVSNTCGWKTSFRRNNARVLADLSISDRRTLEKSRLKLKEFGLINYDKNSTNPNVTYTLTTALNAQDDAQVDEIKESTCTQTTAKNAQDNAQVDETTTQTTAKNAQVCDTKYKLNKTNNKTKQNIEPIQESDESNLNKSFDFKKELINFGFDKKLVEEWLYIRKKKKGINTETAFKIFIREIEKSNIDKNILLQKIVAKSWIGFEAGWLENLQEKKSLLITNKFSYGKF